MPEKKFGKRTKECGGILHHDGDEIDISEFRQQKDTSQAFNQGAIAAIKSIMPHNGW